jgi:hypothetical protein
LLKNNDILNIMSSRFLRFTNLLINVNQIRRIDMLPGSYKIHLIPSEYSGFTLVGSGSFQSSAETYTVSENDHILDYKIVTDWLENEKNQKVWY